MILSINEIIDNYQIDSLIAGGDFTPDYRNAYAVHYIPTAEDADRLYARSGHAFLVAYRVSELPKTLLCADGEEIYEFEVCRELVGKSFFHFVKEGTLEREQGTVRWMVLEQSVSGPNELTLHDSPEIDASQYGHDLLMRLRDVPFRLLDDKELWFKVLDDILNGLKILSPLTHGGSHNALTPDNIWVELESCETKDAEGVATLTWRYKNSYLVDFSFASEPCSGSTPFDQKRLDPKYRARETFLGRYSERSDIYSLGLVLAFIQHAGFPVEVPDTLAGIDIPKYVSQHLPAVEDTEGKLLRAVVRKALKSNLQERYASFDDFHLDLCRVHSIIFGLEPPKVIVPMEPRRMPRRVVPKPELKFHPSSGDADDAPDGAPDFPFEDPAARLNLQLEVLHGDGFKAVAGMEELKKKLRRDFIDIVGHRELAKQYDILPPNLLLIGPPGTGKTYLSTRLAEECGMECSIIKPSDLGSIYVHGSQGMIKQLFDKAEKLAQANHKGVLLVFDEFDAFCPKRTPDDLQNRAGEVAEFLTQLNNCIEKNIYVIGTTNFPDRIDRAVIRKGRIDEVIYVGMPDDLCREQLFEYELSKRPHDDTIDLKKLVQLTAGYNSSDIAYLVKESARCAFEATLAAENPDRVTNITQELLEQQIRATTPSVSGADLRRYERMREEYTHKGSEERFRIGFK